MPFRPKASKVEPESIELRGGSTSHELEAAAVEAIQKLSYEDAMRVCETQLAVIRPLSLAADSPFEQKTPWLGIPYSVWCKLGRIPKSTRVWRDAQKLLWALSKKSSQ